jgi:hypothetical protein
MPARGRPGSELATTTAYSGRRREANTQYGLYVDYAPLAPDFEAAGEPRETTFSTRPEIFSIVKVKSL